MTVHNFLKNRNSRITLNVCNNPRALIFWQILSLAKPLVPISMKTRYFRNVHVCFNNYIIMFFFKSTNLSALDNILKGK